MVNKGSDRYEKFLNISEGKAQGMELKSENRHPYFMSEEQWQKTLENLNASRGKKRKINDSPHTRYLYEVVCEQTLIDGGFSVQKDMTELDQTIIDLCDFCSKLSDEQLLRVEQEIHSRYQNILFQNTLFDNAILNAKRLKVKNHINFF